MHRDHRVPLAALFVVLAACFAARTAAAATIFEDVTTTSARALSMDPSARSLGMGGACGAVTWGADPDHWANPALLGLVRGVRYADAEQRYTLDGDPLTRFRTHRVAIGYGGLGLALSGRPFDGLGGLRLEYPTLTIQGPEGPLVMTLHEQVRSWSVGASASGIASAIAAWRGGEAPRFARWGDVALGYSEKQDEPVVNGASFDRVTGRDLGVLARAGATLRGPAGAGLRLEGAYGFSVLNWNDAADALGNPPARDHRHALAARAALPAPPAWLRRVPAWLVPAEANLLALGAAWDLSHLTAGDSDRGDREVRYWGVETDLAGVFQLRFGGFMGDRHTLGFGAGLPLGRFGGFHYDHARVEDFDGPFGTLRTTQTGWVAWIDPIAIARAAR